MTAQLPRLVLAGTNSGCGKTTVTCAILQALVNRGCSVDAAKCGCGTWGQCNDLQIPYVDICNSHCSSGLEGWGGNEESSSKAFSFSTAVVS